MPLGVATLALKFVAGTENFTTATKRAEKTLRQFGRATDRLINRMSTLGGLLSGTGVLFGLKRLIVDQIAATDRTQAFAASLDIASESLSRFQHAAALADVPVEQLHSGLGTLSKRIGEAVQGADGAIQAFESLGLRVDRLARMSLDEAFLAVSDAMQKQSASSLKASMSADLFGKKSLELVRLVTRGSTAIRKMGDESDALGFTLSSELAETVRRLTNWFDRWKAAVAGLGREMLATLAPAIEKTIKVGLVAIVMLRDHAEILGKTTLKVLKWSTALLGATVAIAAVIKAARLLIGTFKVLTAAIIKVLAISGPAGWVKLAIGIGIAAAATAAMNKTFDALVETAGDFSVAADAIFAEYQQKAEDATKGTEGFADALSDVNAEARKLAQEKSTGKFFDALDNLVEPFAERHAFRGMSEAEIAIAKLKDLAQFAPAFGLDPSEVANINALTREWSSFIREVEHADMVAEAYKDTQEEVKRIFEDTATPMERYEKRLQRLSTLFNAGLLDSETFARAERQLRESLLERGTREIDIRRTAQDFLDIKLSRIAIPGLTGILADGTRKPLKVVDEGTPLMTRRLDVLIDLNRRDRLARAG